MSTPISGFGGDAASSASSAYSTYAQSIVRVLQNAGIIGGAGENGAISVVPQDNSQVSPLGQVLGALGQLQQSNPAEYQQLTAQIAANLTTAAQTAQTAGNTTAASGLTQLATDFTTASQTGQLPNIQDLAQALRGGGHPGGPQGYNSGGNQAAATNNQSLNPLAIIESSLSQATQNQATVNQATTLLGNLTNSTGGNSGSTI